MSDLQLAFRESFLWRLSTPEAAGTVRAFGDLLVDLMNEAGQWGPASNEDSMVRELRAHSRDLEHTVRDLERVADHLHDSDDQEENALADRISGWVGRISLVVLDMHRRLECQEEETPHGAGDPCGPEGIKPNDYGAAVRGDAP